MRNLVFVEGRLIEWLRGQTGEAFRIAAEELQEMSRALELAVTPPGAILEHEGGDGAQHCSWLGRHLRLLYTVHPHDSGAPLIVVNSAEVWEREVPAD